MALKIKKKNSGGGANWMDTYGDMVTLLLCFFVLLYSMSTISEENWRKLVMSFNPDAIPTPTEVEQGTDEGPSADPDQEGSIPTVDELAAMQEAIEDSLEQLYQTLKDYSESSDLASQINVTKGDGYVFVEFNDAVFFEGDKYVLLKEGEEVLGVVAGAIESAVDYIDEVRIMGHTAQARADRPNNVHNDRFLASNRATIVTEFIQTHCSLNGGRIVSVGYGQWLPKASNETSESRALNRRVEIMITGMDVYNTLGDSIERYNSYRTGEGSILATQEGYEAQQDGTDTGGNAQNPTDTGGDAQAPADSGTTSGEGTSE